MGVDQPCAGEFQYLIDLGSEAAAHSPWVGREIAYRLERREPETLTLVAPVGDIGWYEQAGDFDWSSTNGQLLSLSGVFHAEPFHLDMRRAKAEDAELSLKRSRLNTAGPAHIDHPVMHFAYTIVYVPDVEASLAFFERAFGLARRFVAPGGGYGELETGATALAFADHATARDSLGQDYLAAAQAPQPLGMEIGLVTPDVPAAVQRAVEAGATLLKPPTVKPWGQTVAYVRAPDGTLVELCTPMG